MATGKQRFARQQIDRGQPDQFEAAQATVTAVSGATPPVVTVSYNTTLAQFPYLLQYTPVVGHVVAMVPYCGSWLIIGRPGGHP